MSAQTGPVRLSRLACAVRGCRRRAAACDTAAFSRRLRNSIEAGCRALP